MSQTSFIDDAPDLVEDLPGYFEGLALDELRGCWVAVMTDVVWRYGQERASTLLDGHLGPIARAFMVIARRLGGCEFKEIVMAELPVAARATARPTGEAFPPPVIHRPAVVAPTPSAPVVPQASVRVCDGVVRKSGPPPRSKGRSRGLDGLSQSILSLKPGDYLEMEETVITRAAAYQRLLQLKKKNGLAAAVWVYESIDGKTIISYPSGSTP